MVTFMLCGIIFEQKHSNVSFREEKEAMRPEGHIGTAGRQQNGLLKCNSDLKKYL